MSSSNNSSKVDVTSEQKSKHAANKGIVEKLADAGLDGEYWAGIFKNKLGITLIEQTEYLTEEDLQELNGYIKYKWQANALRKCFGITNDTNQASLKEQNLNLDEIRYVLSDIENLKKKGEYHTSNLVKVKLDQLMSLMNVEKGQWIKTHDDASLDDIISKINSDLETLDKLSEGRSMYSATELLKNASAGLALRGILVGTTLNHDIKRTVLKTPSDVKLMNPIMIEIEDEEHLSSKEQSDNFIRSLNTLGHSFTAAAKGSGLAYAGIIESEAMFSNKYEEEVERETESHKQTICESRIRYVFIPTAACELYKNSLELSHEALQELKNIDRILIGRNNQELVNKKCEEFLNTYGSHVNVGVLHFGGVHKFVATYTSDDQSDSAQTKSMMQDALNAYVSASYSTFGFSVGGSITADNIDTDSSTTGSYKKSEMAKTRLSTIRNGGPQEVSALPLWKMGLVTYNSTWALIDRGKTLSKDTLGVWNLVSNHKVDFQKPYDLVSSLKKSWERMIGHLGVRDIEEPINKALDAMEEMMTEIATLNSCLIEPEKCTEHLNWILETVEHVEELTGTHDYWVHELETNKHLTGFLVRIVELKDQFEDDTAPMIRYLIRKLIKPANMFPEKRTIMNWAQGERVKDFEDVSYTLANAEVKSIPDLIRNMKETFVKNLELEHARNERQDAQIRDNINWRATTDLTLCVNKLLTHLKMSKKFKQMFFLIVILLSVDYKWPKKIFKRVLTVQKMCNFVQEIDALWVKFNLHAAKSRIQHEAFLFHLLLTSGHFGKQSSEAEFSDITKNFRLALSVELVEVLDRYATQSPFDWDEMTSVTAELEKGNLTALEVRKVNIPDLKDINVPYNTGIHHEDQSRSYKHGVAGDAFPDILATLGLEKYYPSKISLSDALVIKEVAEHPTFVDLPWMIIHRLIMIDYRARDQLFTLVNELEDEDDYGLNDFLEYGVDTSSDENETSRLNPLDVLVAIFACCDNILKQVLSQKMSICKLAIPFLYPQGPQHKLMMSLWALRTTVVHCHTNQKTIKETPVTAEPLPLLTFVRLGRPPISKSKLMNVILRDDTHDTFFNHKCKNGTVRRKLTNGLVECSWFIPARMKGEHLPRTSMFLNLRGDASSMKEQLQILQDISSVLFVIVTAHDLAKRSNASTCQEILQSDANVILLIIGNNRKEYITCVRAVGKDLIKRKKNILMKYNVREKSPIDLKTNIRSRLSQIIVDGCDCKNVEECAQFAEQMGVIIDEHDDDSCIKGKTLADNVIRHIKGKSIAECRDLVMPLQGIEWRKYCQILKKQHRKSKTAYEAGQMNQKMNRHRKKQVEICQGGLTPLMKDFVSNLQEKQATVLYFLKWLTIFLDSLSRNNLPNLRGEYKAQYLWFQKSNIDCAEHQLASSSLGLEHLFRRELGQIYEAVKGSIIAGVESKADVDKLPEIAAKLLMKGNPVEIVDGDTSSVPITWVRAVLKELGNIIGEKRIFVVAVLGIQSSGKSTLLNTMFGLQFSVSAGRCTRGAYMQLIPVDKHRLLPCDYIAVIDTEGLRAQELSQCKYDHDNELATLVIGLGDVTIVNIKGENTCEMNDILQIAVHAFLRMNLVSKNIKNNKTCIFVHQNVPACNANKMLMLGQKLQETLDDMTEDAANCENIADIYSFSQIIDFDVQKHVWYFSDLWKGNPPMAPANPDYSDKVLTVRHNILENIAKTQTTFLTTSDLANRITDLWDGVLADGFVFSFRNSSKLKVFNRLEDEYFKQERTLKTHLESWINAAANQLMVMETVEELEYTYEKQSVELHVVLNEKAEKVHTSLKEYCSLKEIFFKWRGDKLKQLSLAVEQLKHQAMANLLSIKEARRVEVWQWPSIEKCIVKKATDLAGRLKGKTITDDELKQNFDIMWMSMNENKTTCDDEEQDIHSLMEEILRRRFESQRHILIPELERHPLTIPVELLNGSITYADLRKEHISLRRIWNPLKAHVYNMSGNQESRAKHMTLTLTEHILEDISTYLENLWSNHHNKSYETYAIEIITKIKDGIETFNADDSNFFKIRHAYTVKLAIHVSRHCVRVFNRMQSDYNKKRSVNAKLIKCKEFGWSLFKNVVKQSIEEVMAGDILCRQLKKIIVKAVRKNILRKVVEDFLPSFPNKYALIVKILEDLAFKGNFENYKSYFNDPKQFAVSWLTQYTNEKLFEQKHDSSDMSLYANIAKRHIQTIMGLILRSVEHATKEVERTTPIMKKKFAKIRMVERRATCNKMKNWVEIFCEGALEVLPRLARKLSQVQHLQVVDFNHLKAIILDQLDEVETYVVNVFAKETECTVRWNGNHPSSMILDMLWGCDALCPFCEEPCSNITSGHYDNKELKQSHRCVKHKPVGINKGTRWKNSKELCYNTCNYYIQCDNVRFPCGVCNYECRKHKKCTTTGNDYVMHEYQHYKTYLEEWDIDPDSNSSSKYWMWFMNKYKYQLAKWRQGEVPKLPKSWEAITLENALKDLRFV